MSIKARTLANGGRVWDVEVYMESRDARGRRRKSSRTVKTKQEAIRLEARLKVEAEGGGVRDSKRTVSDLLDEWLKAGNWSPSTRYDYERLVEREIRKRLGTVKLDRLGPRHLERLYADMRKRGLAPRTVRNVHRLLSTALSTGVRWGWLPANVAERASVGHTAGPQGRVATREEVEALLAHADPEMALVVRLAVVTGARRSELCALDWSDVDFNTGTLTIARAMIEAGGRTTLKDCKNHAARVLLLDAATLALLRQHRGIGPLLGLSPSGLSKRFTALCRQAGVSGLGLHSLRHFCATYLLGTTDVRTVANRLGHRDASVTLNTYAHALQERDRSAADALGQVLG